MKPTPIMQHRHNGIVIPARVSAKRSGEAGKAGIQKQNIWIPICMGMTATFVLLLAGCTTYEGGARAAANDREDLLVLREDMNRCKSRLETMEIEQQKILGEIQQLRSKSSDDPTRARLDELERRLAALDAARADDRKEIVDQISANVARMIGGATTGKTTAPKTKASGASASGTGYEHVVKEGETLSAIAAAYKVKINAVIETNDLKKPYILRKGQKLFIPQQ